MAQGSGSDVDSLWNRLDLEVLGGCFRLVRLRQEAMYRLVASSDNQGRFTPPLEVSYAGK